MNTTPGKTIRRVVSPSRVVLPRVGLSGYHQQALYANARGSMHMKKQGFCIRSSFDDISDDDKKVSIDLNSVEGASRRSMLVGFTCDACGGRTERLVNPLAWAKGMVIVQCEHCKAWHKIADANNMVEEYRFDCSDDE